MHHAGKFSHFLLGNLTEIMKEGAPNVFIRLTRDLGPVFKVVAFLSSTKVYHHHYQ